MNSEIKRCLLLRLLLIASIVSTAIHFTDNYLHFEQYPQPDWITTSSVYRSWIIWTVIGIAGYWLYKNQWFWLSYICLVVYSFCGLVSLAHYRYGAMTEFSPKMHFFIVTDGLAGFAILGFTLWSSLILQEQFKNPVTSVWLTSCISTYCVATEFTETFEKNSFSLWFDMKIVTRHSCRSPVRYCTFPN